MIPATLIAKKRDGLRLTNNEIRNLVFAFTDGSLADYQMSAWAMAVLLQGMDDVETAALTTAMLESGQRLQRLTEGPPRVDKHSTGGLGDKVSLILAPLLAECGLHVPMISGRGLGKTGGTLDKLESIRGFQVLLEEQAAARQLQEIGCFIIGANATVAPADRKLYALRDVTAAIESVPLITASILSKKLAASLDALVMDVKVGSAAFMQSVSAAQELADALLGTSGKLSLPMEVFLTDMDQPLGAAVGNACEVNEAIAVLQNHGPSSVREVTIALCAAILQMTGIAKTISEARNILAAHISSGRAYERFCRMVAAQGGKLDGALPLESPHELVALRSGFVSQVDNERIATAITTLGGGRKRLGDPIDHSVGWQIHVRIGDEVQKGQRLATLFAPPAAAIPWVQQSDQLFTITDSFTPVRSLVLSHHTLARTPWQRLAARAIEAGQGAHAPYSHFQVGAALLSSDGRIFTGCNIENASYGATICAERVAASSAIAAGCRSWQAIAVSTPGGAAPCGICRQFLYEFASDLSVLLVDSRTAQFRETSLQQLLPHGFSQRDL